MHYQHGVLVYPNGTLAVFNNNNIDIADSAFFKGATAVDIFTPGDSIHAPAKVWNYTFDRKTDTANYSQRMGNIDFFGSKMLVCMGSRNHIVELSSDKQINWDIACENKSPAVGDTNKTNRIEIWNPMENYRAHIVPSLYPVQFAMNYTVQNTPNGTEVVFTISNNGIKEDAYTLEVVKLSDNLPILATTLPKVEANGGQAKKMLVLKNAQAKGNLLGLKVIISSKNSPVFWTRSYTL
jgi:hypothetical protein